MRLINADALEKDIRELLFTEEEPSRLLTEAGQRIFNSAIEVALFEVVEAEAIDAVPVVHARWIEIRGKRWNEPLGLKCSNCGRRVKNGGENYCPKCGAKMDGGADDDRI